MQNTRMHYQCATPSELLRRLEIKTERLVVIHSPKRAFSVLSVMDYVKGDLKLNGYNVLISHSFMLSVTYSLFFRRSVHIFNLDYSWLSFAANFSIFWSHGLPNSKMSWLRHLYVRSYYKISSIFCNEIVCVSNLVAGDFLKWYKVPRVWSVSNYLSAKSVFNSVPCNLSNVDKEIDVVYIGRFSPLKRADLILDVFERLSKEGFKCAAYGYPACNSQYYGGQLNHPEAVYDTLRRSKSFISLNKYEPYGLTIIEAGLSGCHVFSCQNTGALQDIEKHNITVFDCNTESPDYYSEIILNYLRERK